MPHTKKCNPLLIVGLVILLVFLGLVAFVGYHAVDAAKASPNLAIDYIEELRDLSRSHQPLSGTQPNRYHEVQGLLDLVRSTIENLPEGSDPNFSLLYTDYEPEEPAIENPFFDEPTHEELVARASLALDALENEGVFEKLAEWPQIRHAVNDTWPSGHKMRSPLFVSIDFMNVGEYRRLSRALIAHAHIKMEAGDSDAAIDDFEQSLAVARIATCEPFLLSTLVGIACDAITCNAIRGDITEHRLSAKQLDRIETILSEQQRPPIDLAFNAERLMQDDLIQRTYSDDGNGDGFLLLTALAGLADPSAMGPVPQNSARNILGKLQPSRKETTERLDTYYADGFRILHSRDESIVAQVAAFDAAADSIDHTLLSFLLPPLSRVIVNSVVVENERNALHIVIALERHFIEHSSYPESLDALYRLNMPDLLEAQRYEELAMRFPPRDALLAHARRWGTIESRIKRMPDDKRETARRDRARGEVRMLARAFEIAMGSGETSLADALKRKMTELAPRDWYTHHTLASATRRVSKASDEALTHARTAMELLPLDEDTKSIAPVILLAKLLDERGEKADAIEDRKSVV